MLRSRVRFDSVRHARAAARIIASALALAAAGCGGGDGGGGDDPPPPPCVEGAYCTDEYPNLFVEVLGKTQEEVDAKVNAAFDQLFFSEDPNLKIYIEVDEDEAYVLDVVNDDIRSEGMSYGMMVAVQLDRKDVFDRLWTFAKTRMQHASGPLRGYFAWDVDPTSFLPQDPAPAPDGEEWFVTALFMAGHRWGDGAGIYDYTAEAQLILDTALHADEDTDRFYPAGGDDVGAMFNETNRQILFQPFGEGATFTDPSYHVPAFYELWARWADKDQAFWCNAAAASRALIAAAAHDTTGLSPDYSTFSGVPYTPTWAPDPPPGQDHRNSLADAQRVPSNIGVDQLWFRRGGSNVDVVQDLLAFYRSDALTTEGVATFCNSYTLTGTCLSGGRLPPNDPANFRTSSGLLAMTGAAVHATPDPSQYADFLQALWDAPVPTGGGRYYGGFLYLLGLLETSGMFQVHHPAGSEPVGMCE